MITRYRNQAIGAYILAVTTTVLLVIALRKRSEPFETEWENYIIPFYLASSVLWVVASLSLAKAKGYGTNELGQVMVVALLLAACCCHPIGLVLPLIGLFVKDRVPSRRRSRRWREDSGANRQM